MKNDIVWFSNENYVKYTQLVSENRVDNDSLSYTRRRHRIAGDGVSTPSCTHKYLYTMTRKITKRFYPLRTFPIIIFVSGNIGGGGKNNAKTTGAYILERRRRHRCDKGPFEVDGVRKFFIKNRNSTRLLLK